MIGTTITYMMHLFESTRPILQNTLLLFAVQTGEMIQHSYKRYKGEKQNKASEVCQYLD